MPDTCGHQCSLLRQGLCVGCSELEQQMKITFSYYSRGQPAVQLTINYVPKLDNHNLSFGGFRYRNKYGIRRLANAQSFQRWRYKR